MNFIEQRFLGINVSQAQVRVRMVRALTADSVFVLDCSVISHSAKLASQGSQLADGESKEALRSCAKGLDCPLLIKTTIASGTVSRMIPPIPSGHR